jgi:hypothetical protein
MLAVPTGHTSLDGHHPGEGDFSVVAGCPGAAEVARDCGGSYPLDRRFSPCRPVISALSTGIHPDTIAPGAPMVGTPGTI